MPTLLSLDNKLLVKIFKNLEYLDLKLRVQLVSHRFRKIIIDKYINDIDVLNEKLFRFSATEPNNGIEGVRKRALWDAPKPVNLIQDEWYFKSHPCIKLVRLKYDDLEADGFNFERDVGFFNANGKFTRLVDTNLATEKAFERRRLWYEFETPEYGDLTPCVRSSYIDGINVQVLSVREFMEFFMLSILDNHDLEYAKELEYTKVNMLSWCGNPDKDIWSRKHVSLNLHVPNRERRDLVLFGWFTEEEERVLAKKRIADAKQIRERTYYNYVDASLRHEKEWRAEKKQLTEKEKIEQRLEDRLLEKFIDGNLGRLRARIAAAGKRR